MGQSESITRDVDFSNVPTLGYRVLGVNPDSPASDAGLVSFFDFLVGANGLMLFGGTAEPNENDAEEKVVGDVDFVGLLQDSLDKPVELLVFNIKSQETRLCYITPSTGWGGEGLLGVTIRVDSYANAEENLLRVLSVEDSSPAQNAGLKAESDYLLGTKTSSFSSPEILYQVLLHNEDVVTEIYVYNTESDIVRVVNILPTYSWGGGGLLGAEVGSGYLHRIPKECRSTTGSSLQKDGSINESKGTAINLSDNKIVESDISKEVQNETTEPMKEDIRIEKSVISPPASVETKEKKTDDSQSLTIEPQSIEESANDNDTHVENNGKHSESPSMNSKFVDVNSTKEPMQLKISTALPVDETIATRSNNTKETCQSNEQTELEIPVSTPEHLPSPPMRNISPTQTPAESKGGIFSTFFPPPPIFSKNNINN